MRMKKLYTHHSIYLLFAVCWLSYFSTYLGRLNFTACIAGGDGEGAMRLYREGAERFLRDAFPAAAEV